MSLVSIWVSTYFLVVKCESSVGYVPDWLLLKGTLPSASTAPWMLLPPPLTVILVTSPPAPELVGSELIGV